MKYLITYKQLLEFNRKDKKLLFDSGMVEHFTLAFEFELETDDENVKVSKVEDKYLLEIFKKLRVGLDIDKIDYDLDFLKQIVYNQFDFGNISDSLDNIMNSCKNKTEEYIVSNMINIIDNLEIEYEEEEEDEFENLGYVINKIGEYLPNFYTKYYDDLKFEFDQTLSRGVEFSPKKYVTGLDKGLEMINDFYDDFNKQDYWYMNNHTSIHINIGLNKDVDRWNFVKGLIMMVETSEKPYIYKDIEYRQFTAYCQTFLDKIKKGEFPEFSSDNFVDDVEKFLEIELKELSNNLGSKTFGMNLRRIIDDDYVEFRFVGGDVDRSLMIDKIFYFCYIVYLMVSDYKDLDYHKKLYKYVVS